MTPGEFSTHNFCRGYLADEYAWVTWPYHVRCRRNSNVDRKMKEERRRRKKKLTQYNTLRRSAGRVYMWGMSFPSQNIVNKNSQEIGCINLFNIFVINFYLRSGICLFSLKIIKLVLSIFSESLFGLNQLDIPFNSVVISFLQLDRIFVRKKNMCIVSKNNKMRGGRREGKIINEN